MQKTLICIPCMDMVHTDFMISLTNLERPGPTYCAVTKSSLVYDARNALAKQAMQGDYDRILWLDSDVQFDADLLIKLSQHIDDGLEFVSGLYFKRCNPTMPVIYKEIKQTRDGNELSTEAICFKDYPRNQLFEINASGFGAVLMTTDLVKRVWDKYGLPFSPALGLGEDMTFCWRAMQVGAKLYCDSSIKLKHIGLCSYSEDTYLNQVNNGKEADV